MTDPILIAGAGPVGLTLAVELARYGVPVRIIDSAAAASATSKALAISLVTRLVHHELRAPETAVLGRNAPSLAVVRVPIATINEDNRTQPGEYEIRLPG